MCLFVCVRNRLAIRRQCKNSRSHVCVCVCACMHACIYVWYIKCMLEPKLLVTVSSLWTMSELEGGKTTQTPTAMKSTHKNTHTPSCFHHFKGAYNILHSFHIALLCNPQQNHFSPNSNPHFNHSCYGVGLCFVTAV